MVTVTETKNGVNKGWVLQTSFSFFPKNIIGVRQCFITDVRGGQAGNKSI